MRTGKHQLEPELNNEATSSPRDLEPLLDEFEYARIIGRSVSSIRRDRVLGAGCPYVKLGSLVRYRPADVRSYLELNLRHSVIRPAGTRLDDLGDFIEQRRVQRSGDAA